MKTATHIASRWILVALGTVLMASAAGADAKKPVQSGAGSPSTRAVQSEILQMRQDVARELDRKKRKKGDRGAKPRKPGQH
jgi:hypothetical protein